MAGGPRIIVGIDFGTTYSGVAFALQSSPDDVEVVRQWPGARKSEFAVLKSSNQELILAGTMPKTPTTISYEAGKLLWGYQTAMFGEVVRGIKLLLDPTQEIDYTPAVQSKKILAKYDKEPVDVARDYLQLLVNVAKETLRRRFGNALDSMVIRYVLTVPAVWTDKAKNMTLTAATDAGISALDVTLVSEPEAAALSCLNAIQPNTTENSDVVIICDAGGGTVDLISYRVKSVNPLELMEVTEGTGLEGGFLNMIKENVGRIFLPVVDEVERLVQDQMVQISMAGMRAKAIFLVGGFGSSEYLFRRLQSAVVDVTVLQPPNAWSAVVRYVSHSSAAIFGVSNKVPVERFCEGWEETSTSLYICHLDDAPDHLTEDVFKVCTLEANLSAIPRNLFRSGTNSLGQSYYTIPYQTAMTPTSASILFNLEFNGVSYGSVQAKY
ncbi:hypothetical protein CNMCM5623_009814 [Aspergillus felis]|uniref:Actin-like ATPase domain-containing protein n=1 Tax=Aspergillus felis TaxID=1287682 RepID=A0A8H6Q4R9_9EURO|nr:hypothetical protein CNMCM5623_009814 [Aspergillus felis]